MVPLVASTIAFVNALPKKEARHSGCRARLDVSWERHLVLVRLRRVPFLEIGLHLVRSLFFSGVPFQGLSVCLCEPQSLCCRGSSLGRSLLIELPFGGNAYAKGTP